MMLDPLYRKRGDAYIAGRVTVALIHSDDRYYLTNVEVFQDGVIYCLKQYNLEEFKAEVRRGRIVSQLPEGASLSIRPGTDIIASRVTNIVEDEELIKEVEDLLCELNGEQTSVQRCRDALQFYTKGPSIDARQRLLEAYTQVPKHKRIFIGGMESKDSAVRAALGLDNAE